MNEHLRFTDEEIVDYLDGKMETPMMELLEMAMTMDEILKQRVEKMRVAILAVKQIGLKEKIKEITIEGGRSLTTPHSSGQAPSRRHPVQDGTGSGAQRRIIRYTMAVAASVILFILVFRMFQKDPTNDDLFRQAYVDYRVDAVRGNESASAIETAYSQENYKSVESMANSGKNISQKDSLLAGLSYLKTNQPSNAIKWLEPVSHGGQFSQDAEFYLALSYLKNGDTRTAASLMRKIHDDPEHVYRNQFSDKLIKQVERD